jgi:8-oxo-dGTP diphosphatase
MVRTRRRGTAIVDTPDGILVVSLDGRRFLTPGGGAHRDESRQDAAIRELEEETGLKGVDATFLFEFTGVIHRGPRGGLFRNAHKVFLVTATGVAEPKREVKHVAYYDGAGPRLSYSAQEIISRYYSLKKGRPGVRGRRRSGAGK